MVKRGNEIIGLPIICTNEKIESLEVKDIIYSSETQQIIAFVVDEGGYFHEKRVVAIKNIVSIGLDHIIIKDGKSIEKIGADITNYDLRNDILGLEIFVDDGKEVGKVQDLLIEISGQRVLGLILTEGVFDDLIEGRPIIPLQSSLNIEENKIIINKDLNEAILHNTGGLKRLFSLE